VDLQIPKPGGPYVETFFSPNFLELLLVNTKQPESGARGQLGLGEWAGSFCSAEHVERQVIVNGQPTM